MEEAYAFLRLNPYRKEIDRARGGARRDRLGLTARRNDRQK
jgi:hypothetical protein